MEPTAYLPGMRRGRRARNLVVGVVYLVSLPLVVVSILLFTGYVVVTSRFGRPEIGGGGRLAGSGTSLHPMFTRMAMLAITVVAATGVGGAVAAGFVTLPAADVPQASFSFEATGPHTVEITHVAGDQLDAARVTVRVGGDAARGSWQPAPIRAGSRYRVTDVEPGETIQVVYTGSKTTSTVLASHEYEGG